MAKRIDKIYDPKSIHVLRFPENIRKRPGMYIGDTSSTGLNHLVEEIVANSVDEFLAGHAKNIHVSITTSESGDEIVVIDDGRGIPPGKHPTEKVSSIQVAATQLHAGGKFGQGIFRQSTGLHGVGLSVVNALSKWMKIEVVRSGQRYQQEYKEGKSLSSVKKVGKAKGRGTTVCFIPDSKIFSKNIRVDVKAVSRRLRELAFLNPGLKIHFKHTVTNGESVEDSTEYCYKDGIREYVSYMSQGKTVITPVFCYESGPIKIDNIVFEVEVACAYDDGYDTNILSFANCVGTIEGGTHLNAIQDGMCKVIQDVGSVGKILKEGLTVSKRDVSEGLTMVINVRLDDPEFEGQTKTKLGNPKIRVPLQEWFMEQFGKTLRGKHKENIIEKVLLAIKARNEAKRARQVVRKKGSKGSLPGKLADCSSRNPDICELFIVEGSCFAGETLIHTKDGLKRLDEVMDGDMIYTHMHRWRSAIRRKSIVKKKKCRITIQGREFVCSEDHLWLILRIDEDGEPYAEWVPAKEINTSDLIVKTALVPDGDIINMDDILAIDDGRS